MHDSNRSKWGAWAPDMTASTAKMRKALEVSLLQPKEANDWDADAFNGHLWVVQLLTAKGANVQATGKKFGVTAAGWAKAYGHEHVYAWLQQVELYTLDF